MPEVLIDLIAANPYLVVGAIFVLCGIGLPLPEEIVLVVAGYSVFKDSAELVPMMGACAVGMALGDMVPYLLGRKFGVRLLRLRPLRVAFTRERLARFDRWFRGRGEYVVFFARFIAGIRTVAFFTAGTMRMPVTRFALLDGAGILLLVPTLVYAGFHFGSVFDEVIEFVKKVERSALIASISAGIAIGIWYWLRRRRLQRRLVGPARDTYVEPKTRVRRPPEDDDLLGPPAPTEPTSAGPTEQPSPESPPHDSASGPVANGAADQPARPEPARAAEDAAALRRDQA